MEPPDACYRVFEGLIEDRKLGADDVWLRMRRLAAVDKTGGVRTIAQYLPTSQAPDDASLNQALDKAVVYLVKLPGGTLSKTQRELAALALIRMAKSDPGSAYERYQRVRSQLTGNERGAALAAIAWQAAFRLQPEAADWYRDIGDLPSNTLSDEQQAWRVRAALRVQDWGQVRTAIEKMPPALAADPAWVYWLGRAYHAGGRTSEAHALFAKIAGQPNFYGNLADDELGRPIVPPPKAKPPTRDEQTQALTNPGLKRALAFFRLGLRTEAVKEWNWALRGMNDRELLAAADLAHRNEIFDRAINTADKTKNEHDYNLRYLAPYGDQVRPAARQQGLDGAWVYGLMRQESRFIPSAKSAVGAAGLMQVMPATARWVAKKIGLRDFQPSNAHDPETNILLGTSYLRLVLESLDNHPVLASAAYNAGPGRAKKWRDAKPLEGAIYAETIPFSETRDYVKKVMSNAVYYSAIFDGKPQTLKARLGIIAPRGVGDTKAEDLP
jgi:soluble lytic murein transglycosylase